MKTKISIALNIILMVALIAIYVGHQISDHYYKEFTGFILSSSARQIQAGNSKLVGDILSEDHGRPTYGDLISIYEKLNAKKSAEDKDLSLKDKSEMATPRKPSD